MWTYLSKNINPRGNLRTKTMIEIYFNEQLACSSRYCIVLLNHDYQFLTGKEAY